MHFVGWALLETNSQSCRNLPEQCPPSSKHLVGWALLEINPQLCRNLPEQCPPTRVHFVVRCSFGAATRSLL
ncbi:MULTISPECIES: hypothetical protein [unclassified Moorena]|uniref:hypothetical protein n=1 Tax=unclassified Moorena TaxID=2683338 RepID=UPI0013FFABBF|nr:MULTISPECIES: hypothetical protein [unclassified Moorena]NEO12051.1 hypothetical protein [Moorena sp. SIO3E8]NEQ03489.1 hypothetical protein [Moorena sp. SIO3F7]